MDHLANTWYVIDKTHRVTQRYLFTDPGLYGLNVYMPKCPTPSAQSMYHTNNNIFYSKMFFFQSIMVISHIDHWLVRPWTSHQYESTVCPSQRNMSMLYCQASVTAWCPFALTALSVVWRWQILSLAKN